METTIGVMLWNGKLYIKITVWFSRIHVNTHFTEQRVNISFTKDECPGFYRIFFSHSSKFFGFFLANLYMYSSERLYFCSFDNVFFYFAFYSTFPLCKIVIRFDINIPQKVVKYHRPIENNNNLLFEPRHEKTGILPMRKQRRRSASR